jgi:hypothetical protein
MPEEYHEEARNATPMTQAWTGDFRRQYLIDGALSGMLLSPPEIIKGK